MANTVANTFVDTFKDTLGDYKMTNEQFKDAMQALIEHQGDITAGEHSMEEIRIYMAAGFIIRQRLSIPDVESFSPTPDQVVEFLTGLDRQRRRKLKKIAEGIDEAGTEPIH